MSHSHLVPRSILYNMFLLTVASIVVALNNVEGGYNYPRSEPQLELRNKIFVPGVQSFAEGILNEYKQLDQKKISYSLPNGDYDLLQEHKNVENTNYFPGSFNKFPYQNRNFNRFNSKSNSVYGSAKIGQRHHQLTHHQQTPVVEYLQNSAPQEFRVNNVQQTLHRFVPNLENANPNVPSYLNLQNSFAKVNFGPQLSKHFRQQPLLFNPHSISNVLETEDQNIKPVAHFLDLKNGFLSEKTFTPQANVNDASFKSHNNLAQPIVEQSTVPPVITKHIYFHVPPPDIEEASEVKPTPTKKSYKIMFIKVPSQESRNIEELKAAYNRLGASEDKTLIYVLSNNSKDSQLVVPAYKPSEHEVLFVKYNGDQSIESEKNLLESEDTKYKREVL